MIFHVVRCTFLSILCAVILVLAGQLSGSTFLIDYLRESIITILVALLAINSATLGLVLTKVRELVDKSGGGSNFFKNTKANMLLSIREQISLVFLSLAFLSISDSALVSQYGCLSIFLEAAIVSLFIYGVLVLYDTAKSILVIIDYDPV